MQDIRNTYKPFSRKTHYLRLASEATAFMVTPKMILNAHTLFLITYKTRNIILETEQTIIVYAQCDRWTSYDMVEDHMTTTDVISK